MERIGALVYRLHIKDTHAFHPGGTNIYFVGDPDKEMILVDTGEHDRQWTGDILEAYRELGKPRMTAIVITHGHGDHIGGLDRLHDVLQAPVRCHPKLVNRLVPVLGEQWVSRVRSRERIRTGGGAVLEARFTPGHVEEHVCFFLLSEKIVFTGDTILGSSTTTVQDLASYMRSLSLIQRFKPAIICGSHGKIVTDAPAWVAWYISHRNLRETQVLEAMKEGLTDADQIARHIYPKNLKRALRQAAANNVRQHLTKLEKAGLVQQVPARYVVAG